LKQCGTFPLECDSGVMFTHTSHFAKRLQLF